MHFQRGASHPCSRNRAEILCKVSEGTGNHPVYQECLECQHAGDVLTVHAGETIVPFSVAATSRATKVTNHHGKTHLLACTNFKREFHQNDNQTKTNAGLGYSLKGYQKLPSTPQKKKNHDQ